MRGLFKLESVRIWGFVLTIIGVLMLIATFVLQRSGFARTYPMPPWEAELLILLLGLSIVFILVGITVNKLCAGISRMMQAYDDELHEKFKKNAVDGQPKD